MDLCQPGHHWDFQANACVPDAQQAQPGGQLLQPQQQQQQMPNLQMLQGMMGQQQGPVSGGLGGSVGEMMGGPGSNFMQFGAATPSSSGALANPYLAAAAAILGGGAALQHNNVSSVPHMLKGQWGDDIINSPNVKNFLGNILGQGGEQAARSGAQPFADMIAPSKWKNIPKDLWGGIKEPLSWLKGLV